MTQAQKSRRQILEEFVAANPGDAFARYGLAMELARSGETSAAFAQFEQLIAAHPDYVPGYQMYGQMLADSGDASKARQILTAGIAAAQRTGNSHARDEMRGFLDSLP